MEKRLPCWAGALCVFLGFCFTLLILPYAAKSLKLINEEAAKPAVAAGLPAKALPVLPV